MVQGNGDHDETVEKMDLRPAGARRRTAGGRAGVGVGRTWKIPRLRRIQLRVPRLLPGVLPGAVLLLPARSGLLLSRYRPVTAGVYGAAGHCAADAELLVLLLRSKGV